MNIDWFTFAAQIVNFLVLVALLRWLLYDRIVRAMNKREEKIAGRLEEADQKRKEAEEAVQEYEDKSRQIDKEREELLKEARREAHEERQRLLKEAKEEVEHKRDLWQQAFRRDQEDLLFDLRRKAGEMGIEAARHTLWQLADAELESRLCDTFASRLEQLDEAQREEIGRHLDNGEAEVSIRSAFAVSSEQRERLRQLIYEHFGAAAGISFEQSADLICGLELDVGGYSFGWNVKDFLRDLDLEFSERLSGKP